MEQRAVGEISSRVVTVPNVLSFIRLLLVPVFFVLIVTNHDLVALAVLAASSVTDYVDGQIARRFNQMSRLGQLLDPAADRLLILAALIGLGVRSVLPWWFVAAVIGRDVMLIVLGLVLADHGFGPLPVHYVGKFATFCIFAALPILMLGQALPPSQWLAVPVGWAFALWGAFLYWWAGALYLIETVRVVRLPLLDASSGSDTLGR